LRERRRRHRRQIRDDGISIPPEKLPAMLNLFTQDERCLARTQGRLGITDLTLLGSLVEWHGGRVTATGEGT
jgi:signal transduction histidine kinase